MKIVIDISNYDAEWINNAHYIPDEINNKIADTIIIGTPLPEHHGDLIDRDELLFWSHEIDSMYCIYDEVVDVGDIKNAQVIIEGGDSE